MLTSKTRLADYVIDRLAQEGVRHIFMVSGGGGMHLIDALGRRKDMAYVCNHHEQASAMCAEGYQRVTGNLGVALVTTGPAGTNAITGVACAWNDSIPMLILSGQANSRSLIGDTGLRQRGVHEADITRIVAPITKYAVTVMDARDIRFHLEKALYLSKNGRPGPTWLDIPLDIQSALIAPTALRGFVPPKQTAAKSAAGGQAVSKAARMLALAERPIVIAGHGIRLSHAEKEFHALLKASGAPVVTTHNSIDLVPDSHPQLAGRAGTYGQRAANIAMQNSDLILALGTRLCQPLVGYNSAAFARSAKRIAVDIDPIQLRHAQIRIDLPVVADVKPFMRELCSALSQTSARNKEPWAERCRSWRKKYPVVLPSWKSGNGPVNSYHFFEALSDEMPGSGIVVTDQGATFYSFPVAFKIRAGQRVFTNGGFSPMGYGLPAAIGACFAARKRDVVCVHGDGGLQMNIQELQTIAHHRLPIKLFVFDNQGYLSIKHTQTNYFNGFFVGCDPKSGVSCPSTERIAGAYGIKVFKIPQRRGMEAVIRQALSWKGPVMVDVRLDPMQSFEPRVTSARLNDGRMVSKPLEDMYPFLSREELARDMLVPMLAE